MGRKVVIYLASLANTKFGCSPATVPLEIGYIKAYAAAQLPNETDIQLFRTFESLYEAIRIRKPDIIGCAWYGWNRWLTVNALAYIKSNLRDVLTVVGGANVPESPEGCLRDLKEFPCIDVMIPNEGEIPFVNLVKSFIQNDRGRLSEAAIDGAFHLSGSKESVISGKLVSMEEDINIFPSPYLNGHLDKFLDGELMPILQTSRGCPYHCSFCVSARDSWNKIRGFSLDRVKAEIDYLEAKSKNRAIRFADENFGILPRDSEIAEFIAEKRAKTGYPSAVRLYTNKYIDDRVKKITFLLKDLIPMNISVQTLTDSVLKNIKRQNINVDKLRDAATWAHKNNINVTTEIIFGLPGETYKSFMDVIDKTVELRFDSVSIGFLAMLKEIELNRPESIDKYGYKILFSIAERGYTKAGQFENVEIDALAVESALFNFEEYIAIHLFAMVFQLFMFFGYFKEMVYIWDNRGVRLIDVISELLERKTRYAFFANEAQRFKKCLQDNLFKTRDEVRGVYSKRFSAGNNSSEYIGFSHHFILSKIIQGEMIHFSNQEKMIDEFIAASRVIFDKNGRGELSEFLNETQFAKTFAQKAIIPFWEMPQETVILSSPYDLVAWRNHDYHGMLSEFISNKAIEYKLKVNSISQYREFIIENSKKPFYIQSEVFFRTFRTNNVRRYLIETQKSPDVTSGG